MGFLHTILAYSKRASQQRSLLHPPPQYGHRRARRNRSAHHRNCVQQNTLRFSGRLYNSYLGYFLVEPVCVGLVIKYRSTQMGKGPWGVVGRTRRLKRRWGGGGKTSLMRRIGKWGRRGWMLIGRTCDAKRQDVAHCYDEVERSKIPICHDERDDIQIKLGNRHCGVATGDGMRRI
jgi:hypothetical protein